SVLVAEPPRQGAGGHRRAAVGAPACEEQARAAEPGGGLARTRRPANLIRLAVSTRAVRWTATTRQHRPRAGRRTRAADPRRSDGVVGCLGAGARPRVARRLAT